ncbi:hypothetical protein DLAC_11277 [Tieghemostelium lacteum]|uniref:Dephospho-CoA kinase n=1 Tax=Tieghemostelium lacteum TaxID=361077 RepID=A0A151Z3L4_TIELA|nr:hypothetical protein DLAC_11277 [Tieghemostelium lacteum]|eukprot:KYQ88550.1 hypothetical protein DLAC_11277 [Tieghemostelium lacteum]
MSKLQRIIGVCGLNASGKSTICNFYKDKGYKVLSLSDIIRKTLRENNIEETRDNLIDMGNNLRNKYGAGALAKMTIDTLNQTDNYVIDSIRHPEEVKCFRGNYNKQQNQFILVGIQCDAEIRFQRIQSRNRVGDKQSLEQFKEIEQKEMNNPDPNGQQVSKVLEMSDFNIKNNFNNFDDFNKEIQLLDSQISK